MLPDALKSVSWANEIIVGIDTTSEDNTDEIARDAGATVIEIELGGNFAAAKNELIHSASTEWVLILDADERITPELASTILQIDPPEGVDCYRLHFRSFTLGAEVFHCGWNDMWIPRLVRRNKANYSRGVHEYITVGGSTVDLQGGSVIHYTHDSFSEFLYKVNFYTDLEVKTMTNFRSSDIAMEAASSLIEEFALRYIKLQGYRDGVAGLTVSIMSALYKFAKIVKCWEKAREFSNGSALVFLGSDDRLRSTAEKSRNHGALFFEVPTSGSSSYVLFGPYIDIDRGNYQIEISVKLDEVVSGVVICDAFSSSGLIAVKEINCASFDAEKMILHFSVEHSLQQLEIRLLMPPGAKGKISSLAIQKK